MEMMEVKRGRVYVDGDRVTWGWLGMVGVGTHRCVTLRVLCNGRLWTYAGVDDVSFIGVVHSPPTDPPQQPSVFSVGDDRKNHGGAVGGEPATGY